MKNSIAENIANFLVEYPPFSQLTYDELTQVAMDIRVLNVEKRKSLFQINYYVRNLKLIIVLDF